ncbi:hypothetical protein GEMRC1_002238 [Eukaryota sp. GEM-RC1]
MKAATGPSGAHNILGDSPLLPGKVYNWKVRIQGPSGSGAAVGVIDRSMFVADRYVDSKAHCIRHTGTTYGCLSKGSDGWKNNEVLEITVNMITNLMTIKSTTHSLNTSGNLPSGSNYYPFFYGCQSGHQFELIE